MVRYPTGSDPPTLEDIEAAEASFMEQFAEIDDENTPGSTLHPTPVQVDVPSASGSNALPAVGLVQPRVSGFPMPQHAVIHAAEEPAALVTKIVGWWNTLAIGRPDGPRTRLQAR